jgi:hypothetical protein
MFAGAPLCAQPWDALRDVQGKRVKVLDTAGVEHKGVCAAVTADAITVQSGNAQVSIEKTKVKRIQAASGTRRVRNLVIGAAAGVAVGLVTDQTLGQYLRNETGESAGARAVTYVAPIALFGGIGAALSGYHTVYRAP